MYLSSKKHILSNTLIFATAIQFLSIIIQLVLQSVMLNGKNQVDMLDDSVWAMQHFVTSFSIVFIVLVFFIAIKRIRSYIGVVDEEDRAMMGRLQEDSLGKELSALPAEMIYKLLFLWGVILVGVGIIQTMVLVMYRKFIVEINTLDDIPKVFKVVYNNIDGFKNLTIVFALLLGIVITAVVLENRKFTIMSIIIAILYLIAFCAFNLKKVDLFGAQVGIGWTTVVFYAISTVGMILFAVYLRIKYRGV
ncbi:MAG: hypothetical protein IK152_09355 [Lachnospiraceae bacterium]|nr:hypothetical protein [Lachnospiraceae bacterium]